MKEATVTVVHHREENLSLGMARFDGCNVRWTPSKWMPSSDQLPQPTLQVSICGARWAGSEMLLHFYWLVVKSFLDRAGKTPGAHDSDVPHIVLSSIFPAQCASGLVQ